MSTASTASTTASTTVDISDDDFLKVVKAINPVTLFVARCDNGDRIAYTLSHDVAHHVEKVAKIAKAYFNCRTCVERARQVACTITNSQVFTFDNSCQRSWMFQDLVSALRVQPNVSTQPTVHIHTGSVLFDVPLFVGDFAHWTIPISMETRTNAASANIELYTKAIHRYVTGDQVIQRIVYRLIDQGMQSIDLMSQIMEKSTYGDKFLGSIAWTKQILEYINKLPRAFSSYTATEKTVMCIQFLMWTPIEKDFYDAVSKIVHQTKENVIDLLESATNEKALLKMLNERVDPTKYCRRDTSAELSIGSIQIAENTLGEFTNSVMTIDELMAIPQTVPLTGKQMPDQSSSLTAFAQMKLKASKETSQPASFASRCGVTDRSVKIKNLQTMEDVVSFLREHPDTTVEISGALNRAYITSTTLRQECRSVPHFWGFIPQSEQYTRVRVEHILPMYEYIPNYCNVFFRFATMKPSGLGNCCFPEFLATEYQRVCGKAFERMNTSLKMVVPDGDIAYGIGISGTDRHTTLRNPIHLHLDGISVTIRKMQNK